jgi:hypothetical protein
MAIDCEIEIGTPSFRLLLLICRCLGFKLHLGVGGLPIAFCFVYKLSHYRYLNSITPIITTVGCLGH